VKALVVVVVVVAVVFRSLERSRRGMPLTVNDARVRVPLGKNKASFRERINVAFNMDGNARRSYTCRAACHVTNKHAGNLQVL
jgi:hypothetical protein